MKPTQLSLVLSSILVLFFAGFISSCKNTESPIKKEESISVLPAKQLVFDKLTGTWQSNDGKNFERWTKNDNGSYKSVAFSVKGTDTSWNEQATIYPQNNNWVFENNVRGQNNGNAIKFISSLLNDNSVQFSNPAHDFPTDINYTVTGNNKVHAFIVGPNAKGGKDTIPFDYKRVE